MRITRLTVRDFRRYRELEIPLSPGLTIVHGPNEAGKTTIQRAIELVLTRKVTSGGADIDGLRSWDAADEARPVIAIEFEIEDDERGVRKGTLEKAFRGAKGTVRLEVDGETITDPTLADQALAELTGIPSEAFFRSTASVRHHELADLDRAFKKAYPQLLYEQPTARASASPRARTGRGSRCPGRGSWW